MLERNMETNGGVSRYELWGINRVLNNGQPQYFLYRDGRKESAELSDGRINPKP